MSLPRFPSTASAADVAGALDAHGCAIVEALAPLQLCDRVDQELRPWIDRTPTGGDDFTGRNTRRTGALLARSPSAVELIAHPLVLDVVEQVLGRETSPFQLHLTQAIAIGPGSPAQQLHRDQWCFDFHRFPVDLDVEVSTIWALTDFTADNGPPGWCRQPPDRGHALRRGRRGACRHAARLGGDVHGFDRARRRRERHRGRAPGRQRRLHARMAAPGGEPVPVGPPGGRRRPPRTGPAPDGLRDGQLRPRLHRRRPRPDLRPAPDQPSESTFAVRR